MDGRHEPVRHSVWRALPGVDAMNPARHSEAKSPEASMASNRQTRWLECARTASPVKAGLRPPPPAAKGLDRACRSGLVRHRDFDGGFRLLPAPTKLPPSQKPLTQN